MPRPAKSPNPPPPPSTPALRKRVAKAHAASMTTAVPKPEQAAKSGSDAPLGRAVPPGELPPPIQIGKPGQEALLYTGDCREVLAALPECKASKVDLIFADPPFNWSVPYDRWADNLPHNEYLDFAYDWIGLCCDSLRENGSLWINIPDDWAAEIVVYLKKRGMSMVNWCIWHYRFGQNTTGRFISSKVHALYFCKGDKPTWNPKDILELSDRATTYADKRTLNKRDGMPPGMRVPLDVWYGKNLGRVQGNNKERRARHHNQLPEAYLERVVLASSNPGDLVLDPFLGSGTTGVVAHGLKRRFIGIDFSADNVKSSAERIAAGPTRPLGQPDTEGSAIFKRLKPLDLSSTQPFKKRKRGSGSQAAAKDVAPLWEEK